ncbi:MAG: hypothetical protein ACPGJE_07050, partial [Wenzhouxiangellaceae bacterium]
MTIVQGAAGDCFMLSPEKFLVSIFLVCASLAGSAVSADPADDALVRAQASKQLIVLLSHGLEAPSPEALVRGVSRGRAVSEGLDIGQPNAAEFVIPRRASGKVAEAYHLEPESPG